MVRSVNNLVAELAAADAPGKVDTGLSRWQPRSAPSVRNVNLDDHHDFGLDEHCGSHEGRREMNLS